VDLANQELLAPTPWSRLRAEGLGEALPPEAAAYLCRSHAVNTVRNKRIKAQLADAVRALNARGVEPVLLKGAVDLFVSRYGDPGARILRDDNIFVRASRRSTRPGRRCSRRATTRATVAGTPGLRARLAVLRVLAVPSPAAVRATEGALPSLPLRYVLRPVNYVLRRLPRIAARQSLKFAYRCGRAP
jgi:Uncharacterised nucleotidyltransferase